jgi:hypothetical protein
MNNPTLVKGYHMLAVVEYTFGNGQKENFIETRFNGQRFPHTIGEAEELVKNLQLAIEWAKQNPPQRSVTK